MSLWPPPSLGETFSKLESCWMPSQSTSVPLTYNSLRFHRNKIADVFRIDYHTRLQSFAFSSNIDQNRGFFVVVVQLHCIGAEISTSGVCVLLHFSVRVSSSLMTKMRSTFETPFRLPSLGTLLCYWEKNILTSLERLSHRILCYTHGAETEGSVWYSLSLLLRHVTMHPIVLKVLSNLFSG